MSEHMHRPTFGPFFRERIALARAFYVDQRDKYESKERLYGYIDGEHFMKPRGVLGEIQERIVNRITTLAEQGRDDRPIVYLDVGGGYGLSSGEIAGALDAQKQDQQVVCLVTNLEFVPTAESAAFMLPDPGTREYVLTHNGGIVYLQTDVPHLLHTSLQTANGAVPLRGNVDVIHEFNALSHSKIPDLDYWVLGNLLSDQGTLLISSSGGYQMRSIPDELREAIDASFGYGFENLRSMGLEEGRVGHYRSFAYKDASPL